MAQALAESRNCSSAYIMKQINGNSNEAAKQFVEYLKKCNIKSDIQPYPSIALGAVEISLFEMVQAYTMFPGAGYNAQPFLSIELKIKTAMYLKAILLKEEK